MEKLFIGILVPLVIYGVYYLIKRTEENQRAIKRVLSPEAKAILAKDVHFYQQLSEEKKAEFESRILIFLDQVHIEAVETELTVKDSIFIAASAIIPVFGFSEWRYKHLTNIILYPSTFNGDYEFAEGKFPTILGMVGDGALNGQMLLSQKALHEGFMNKQDKSNTAIHEFVHLIDKMDGSIDGIPSMLLAHGYTLPWLELIRQESLHIAANKSDINVYALENQAEFFAVVSEYFFERPELFKEKHGALYTLLSEAFQQKL